MRPNKLGFLVTACAEDPPGAHADAKAMPAIGSRDASPCDFFAAGTRVDRKAVGLTLNSIGDRRGQIRTVSYNQSLGLTVAMSGGLRDASGPIKWALVSQRWRTRRQGIF